jgi:23S rRNA (uracil1939-C5)-methyltransferase
MARKRSRKKALPELAVRVQIEALSHDGRGVAHVDGKVVFIDEALPGEEVEFIYTASRRDYAEGKVATLISRADNRVEPECPHFGVCGGCSFQHVASDKQINIKQSLLQEQFSRIGKVDIQELWEPLIGPHWGYRRKARMGVKYVPKKNRVLVGFRERRHPYLAEIEACKVMHPRVGTRLMALSEMIGGLSIRDKIPQLEVAIGDEQCVIAVRVLEPPTDTDQQRMREFGEANNIHFYLQSKGPDTIVPLSGETAVYPSYTLGDQDITFSFKPAMFTQVNYAINQKMVNRVLDALSLTKDDSVLDLYCGLGNFTLPLAKYAGNVVGVEGDQPLILHARENAEKNAVKNVEFFAADLSRDIAEHEWANRRYSKILLDPSRAGALDVLKYFPKWGANQIIYVSCNPSTLARDAGTLVNDLGYQLIKAGVMDMFPQTAHVESIALFEKN